MTGNLEKTSPDGLVFAVVLPSRLRSTLAFELEGCSLQTAQILYVNKVNAEVQFGGLA